MRFGVILGGIALGLGGLLVALLFGLIIGFGCEGTDAGEPPPAGTFAHSVCESNGMPVAYAVLGLTAVFTPIAGGVVAARRRAYSPLLAAAAVAAGAVSLLGLMIHVIERGTANVALFVGLPVLVFLGLLAIAIRQGRAERRV